MKHQHPPVPSWQHWLFIAFPPLAAVLFALALTLPALAATVSNTTFPISFTITNPCNGENVAVSGTGHGTFELTFDGHGVVHVVMTANFQDVTGVGDQGNTYQIPGEANSLVNFSTQVGETLTFTDAFQLEAKGSAPNFLFLFDFHVTVNPDGTITSFQDHERATCPG